MFPKSHLLIILIPEKTLFHIPDEFKCLPNTLEFEVESITACLLSHPGNEGEFQCKSVTAKVKIIMNG